MPRRALCQVCVGEGVECGQAIGTRLVPMVDGQAVKQPSYHFAPPGPAPSKRLYGLPYTTQPTYALIHLYTYTHQYLTVEL